MTSDEARKVAEERVVRAAFDNLRKHTWFHRMDRDEQDELVTILTTAILSAARVPDGCVPSRDHHPHTKDGQPIFMGGCLFYFQEQDGTDTPRYIVTECGVLSITNRDDRHWEDYGECERWIIGIRDTDGIETEVSDADLFATRDAALAARKEGANDE